MNEEIIKSISFGLNIKVYQVQAVLKLLSEGATIPFIARYRKEVTGALDEEQIREITLIYEYQNNLSKRKEDVIRLIAEKGLLTEELKHTIMNCQKLVEVEDLYRPFKEKKKTKATEALAKGLKELADYIKDYRDNINELALTFVNDQVKNMEEALEGACYIIAEEISDEALYRKWMRNYLYHNGSLISKIKKGALDDKKVYEMYYQYEEKIATIKPHRILALDRGEKEKVLTVNLEVNKEEIIKYLIAHEIKKVDHICSKYIQRAIEDSFKRLIFPSIEREIRSSLTEKGEKAAIDNFAHNVESLLLTPPIKEKIVLGFDPAYRTGCKLAVVDKTGKPLSISVIYPHEPRNDQEGSKQKLLALIDQYKIDVIAIGNGTASRESEAFVAEVIKETKNEVKYVMVSEAGASVYSASKLAIAEFPNLHVEERSAISIARRLQDPLAELVKIDPKSIGVGLYQHDVNEKQLDNSLDFVVTKVVNQVGVNINTASKSLLKYISGLTVKAIDALTDYRDKYGLIKSRNELKEIRGFSNKVYEQAIGFMRITQGSNPLDKTSIHPESYIIVALLLNKMGLTVADLGTQELREALSKINPQEVALELKTDTYTLEDIIKSLITPNRDPRDDIPRPLLRSDVLKLDDLKVGMKLQGTVRNVVDFGVFIDIGLKNDGLAHISKLTDKYIKHPSEILAVGDIVDCYVEEIYLDKGKVSLSLIKKEI